MVDTHAALRHHQMNENVFYTSLLVPVPPVNPVNTAGEGKSLNYGAFKPAW